METLADTVVYLSAYLTLAGRDPDDGNTIDCNRADDDCKALEYAAFLLDTATPAEKAAFQAAIERAIASEMAAEGGRYDWLACYEDMLTDIKERRAQDEVGPA